MSIEDSKDCNCVWIEMVPQNLVFDITAITSSLTPHSNVSRSVFFLQIMFVVIGEKKTKKKNILHATGI